MILTEDFKDALKELINISFGSATASIAELFDSFATLHIPKIEVMDTTAIQKKIMEYYDVDTVNLVTQNFKGEFMGEVLFVTNRDNALKIKNVVFEEEEEEYIIEEIHESLLEISNILGVTCVGKLAELLGSELSFMPPVIKEGVLSKVLLDINKNYERVIFIDTILEFKDLNIKSHLFILMTEESFLVLEESLERFLEEL